MNCSEKGALLELKIAVILIQHNWIIYRPILDNATVDTLAISPSGQVFKLQIKSPRLRNFGFQIKITRGKSNCKYTSDEVDYFVTMFEDDLYFFPYTDFLNKTTISVNITNNNLITKYKLNHES